MSVCTVVCSPTDAAADAAGLQGQQLAMSRVLPSTRHSVIADAAIVSSTTTDVLLARLSSHLQAALISIC